MRIMAIDYGDARTGIAFCDVRETLASPYGVIQESYRPKLVSKLAEIAAQEKAEQIVIGLPRNMDGSYGYRCEACRSLGAALSEAVDVPIDYEDERLTTVMAHQALSGSNVHGKKRKEQVDAVAAVMILESYLEKRKSGE